LSEAAFDGADLAVLSALPLGVCLYGRDGRKQTATQTFYKILQLSESALREGASLAEGLLVLAHHGVFGPGDPERQAQSIFRESEQTRLIRHRRPDGRTLELGFAALADGRCLITVADQTSLIHRSRDAEQQARRLTEIIETLPVGVGVFDTAQTVRFANRRFAEILARPQDALPTGLTLEQLAADLPESAQALASALRNEADNPGRMFLETGEVVELTLRHLAAGGSVLTAYLLAASSESDLIRRQRLIDQVLALLPHGICIYGPDHRLRSFNQAFVDLGWKQDISVGDAFAISPVAQPDMDPGRPQCRRGKTPQGTPLDLRWIPLGDGGFACIATDLNAFAQPDIHTLAGEAPGQANLLDPLLASLSQGVLLWDTEGRLIAHNPKAVAYLEVPSHSLEAGRSHTELLTELASLGAFGNADESSARLRDLLERDRSRHHVHRRNNRSGRVLEVHSNPVPGVGFVVTYTDVTEYRVAEESLRRSREAAEAANTAKSRLLATMSHALRTPLNAVIGYSEALTRAADDPAEAERAGEFARRASEFAATINRAGHDLLSLINNILDVARIESGTFELASDQIELTHFVAACVRNASPNARAAEVTIWVDTPQELPILQGDERRLRQVLSQILANAIKFTKSGGAIRIEVLLTQDGDLLIRVTDTGAGISAANQARVFEPFFQVDSELARRTTGPGLGLYVSRALITAHGGTLTLTSQPGQGTAVTIRLPKSRLIQPSSSNETQCP
jgi:signal transduction histidine kinase